MGFTLENGGKRHSGEEDPIVGVSDFASDRRGPALATSCDTTRVRVKYWRCQFMVA